MANRFIPYVPKPTNQKYSNKPLCKNVPKKLSSVNISQRIEQNSIPIRVSTVDGDLPTQKMNGDDGIIAGESLMEICRTGDNGSEDIDDSYLPTIPELISSTFRKDKLAEQGLSAGLTPQAVIKPAEQDLSRGHTTKAIGKLALDEGGYSTNSDKSVPGLHPGDSQDKPILVGEDESDNTGSRTDLSDSDANSTKVNTDLYSRQTSFDTTISLTSSIPQGHDVNSKVSRAARLVGTPPMSKTASLKRVQRPLKRKIRHTPGQSPSDLYEIQDITTYSDGESEVESEFDFNDKLVQKKQRADDSFLDRLKSRLKKGQTEQNELPAAHDPGREGTKDRGDPYDEAIALTPTSDGELDRKDSTYVSTKVDSDIVVPQSRRSDNSHSPPMTPAAAATAPQESVTAIEGQPATLTRSNPMISKVDDAGRPQQEVVTYDQQEWGIHGIIGKEEIDSVEHYWVDWNPTLVPKYELGKAKVMVEKFEARLRKRGKQKRGKRRAK